MYLSWIVLALIIIVSLASYAAFLILKLKKQRQQIMAAKQQKIAQGQAKKAQVLSDIRYIAQAMLDDRCELSEGVMRIVKLFELLSMADISATKYPLFYQHFAVIENHPICEERQALPKQQRMKLDLTRMNSEAELQQGILAEAQELAQSDLNTHH